MTTNRIVPVVLVALLFTAAPALAMDFGVRGGLYTEAEEPFLGVELLSKVGDRVYFNPNVEYVFVDGGRYGTFNFDAHYDLPVGSTPYVWVGAGLAFLHFNPDGPGESDTNAHANLLAGLGFRTRGGTVPYVQLKLITTDPNEFVIAAGVRF
jgi:hypothetical protein